MKKIFVMLAAIMLFASCACNQTKEAESAEVVEVTETVADSTAVETPVDTVVAE